MRAYLLSITLLLAACSRSPKVVQGKVFLLPERDSVVETVRTISFAQVEKEAEPYRSWLIAQRTGICEVHTSQMVRRWIPVAYGLPDFGGHPDPKDFAHFPYGEESWPGGCVVTPTKEREVFLCPECVKACRAWHAKSKEASNLQ